MHRNSVRTSWIRVSPERLKVPDVLGFSKRLPTPMNSKLPQAKFSLPRTRYVFLSILAFFCLYCCCAPAYVTFSDESSIFGPRFFFAISANRNTKTVSKEKLFMRDLNAPLRLICWSGNFHVCFINHSCHLEPHRTQSRHHSSSSSSHEHFPWISKASARSTVQQQRYNSSSEPHMGSYTQMECACVLCSPFWYATPPGFQDNIPKENLVFYTWEVDMDANYVMSLTEWVFICRLRLDCKL